MGQLLHGSAGTTETVRRAIQNSQESIAKLAKRYDLPAAGRQAFLKTYNFAKRLKTLKGLTSYEKIIEGWHKEPERFTINPLQHTAGLYTYHLLKRSLAFVPNQNNCHAQDSSIFRGSVAEN